MNYIILTNNPMTRELVEERTGHELHFIDGSVQAVLSMCEEFFSKGNHFLAADPMGGRRARPFPYLTIILERGRDAELADWERIADYSVLNGRRMDQYENNSESLNEDFRILDCSLTKTALKI
ncbi:GrdX family protein [Anaerovorax odorimutans]|uniref:GrdX family protein n=1 Tax=Anaerovorax odorimutans TaxID=109327 RepID=A0ABT1RML1_9FIRM|nr:GrdX family protein [Anaerovorax odorimutans]MCQ4636429.1 GrdX family protein [Anaerovorax odorimutans]